MNFFRRSKRGRGSRSHPLPPEHNRKQKTSLRSETVGYPRTAQPEVRRDRPGSTQANKALVNKIKDVTTPNSSSTIPDVITSHSHGDRNSSTDMNTKFDQISSRESRVSSKVVKPHEKQGSLEFVSAQIHHENREETNTTVIKPASTEGLGEERKRNLSFTHSETEAVATLDDVLKTFDLDDNFNEVVPEATEETTLKPPVEGNNHEIIASEPPYSSIAELREQVPKSQVTHDIKPVEQHEPVYAKPVKKQDVSNKSQEQKQKHKPVNPPKQNNLDEAPAVPPKRFEPETENQIKFSPLRKMPSASLSQSLNRTDWANANEKLSPKRRPKEDNNKNYSLKKGKLSRPEPRNTEEDYVEPAPDYDLNGTISSTGRSTNVSDDSFTKDNWNGSLSSSSTSGSGRVQKPIRPEALELIKNKKKTMQEEERSHDKLVKRSFRLIREPSLKDDVKSETSSSDYAAVKDDADIWLINSERLRANSQKKRKYFTASSSSDYSTQRNVYPQSEALQSAVQSENERPKPKSAQAQDTKHRMLQSIETDTQSKTSEIKLVRKTASDPPSQQPEIGLSRTEYASAQNKPGTSGNEEATSDDENLVRLMESGVYPESTSSSKANNEKDVHTGYVPRALRMNFGQSWNGIRKDRRAWKSREMSSMVSTRKGSKKLSNRLDEQDQGLEMLF